MFDRLASALIGSTSTIVLTARIAERLDRQTKFGKLSAQNCIWTILCRLAHTGHPRVQQRLAVRQRLAGIPIFQQTGRQAG